MNQSGLDLNSLNSRALALAWGLSSSVAKDGNGDVLLGLLSNVFGEEYAIRTGKLALLGDGYEHEINFEAYSVDDLKKAFCHFCALTAAFESNGQRSSSKFLQDNGRVHF